MTDDLNQLVERLATLTERGEQEWIVLMDDTFRTRVGRGSVMVSESSAHRTHLDGELVVVPGYRVTVCDHAGKVVEQEEVPDFMGQEYERSDRLFKAARRSALRSKDVLAEMLSALPRR